MYILNFPVFIFSPDMHCIFFYYLTLKAFRRKKRENKTHRKISYSTEIWELGHFLIVTILIGSVWPILLNIKMNQRPSRSGHFL